MKNIAARLALVILVALAPFGRLRAGDPPTPEDGGQPLEDLGTLGGAAAHAVSINAGGGIAGWAQVADGSWRGSPSRAGEAWRRSRSARLPPPAKRSLWRRPAG